MILVDTSVWIEHFVSGVSDLGTLLDEGNVLTHPFVIGELACGNLRNREEILADVAMMPAARPASHDEVMDLVGRRHLWSKGIGWIDVHLLASALITGSRLWTLDRALQRAASNLNVRY